MHDVDPEFGPFQISVRWGSGELIALDLAEALPLDWRNVEPVRTPGYYPAQKRHPGWVASVKAGRLLPFESRLEFAHLLLADLRPDVSWMLTQPFRLHWSDGGRPWSHVPDALLLFEGGLFEVLNVTTAAKARVPEIARRLAAMRVACRRLGWRSRTAVGAPPRVELQNARLLASCRKSPYGTDLWRERLLAAAAAGAVSIGALDAAAETQAIVRPVVLHLIATGELECDLERPLTLTTQVQASRGLR